MCAHLLLQELQNYNSLLINHLQENVGSHQKKTPHVQGQRRSLSKMVGGVKLHLESNPTTARGLQGSNKTLCTPGPRDPMETEPDLCLSLLWRYRLAVACHRGRGSGCSRLGCGISPLGGGHHWPHHRTAEQTTHKLQNNYTKEFLPLLRKF